MYLHKLSITNFRKYGGSDDKPGIVIEFNKGLNVLIGENESGKTSIVDAIRYVLQTQSYDFTRIDEIDFHYSTGDRAKSLKIECEFKGFTDAEAGNYLEWIGFDDNNEYVLRVWLSAEIKDNRIIQEIRAGIDNVGTQLDAGARDLLRVTYLKPLRDAEMEMAAGRRSRFAQLLKSRSEFKCKTKQEEKDHPLSKLVDLADSGISDYFSGKNEFTDKKNKEALELIKPLIDNYRSKGDPDSMAIAEELENIITHLSNNNLVDGKAIIETIKDNLTSFTSAGKKIEPFVTLSGVELWAIIQRLTLNIDNNPPSLGLMNLLYIAAELMLLKREKHTGLKLAIIEELEAHLHPHYQINTLKYFSDNVSVNGQVILTTHSVILGSSVPISNLYICSSDDVIPMGRNSKGMSYTELDDQDERFLGRFLDATKANIFFAKGIIFVEGDAENLLVPAISSAIDLPLHKYGVSVVNVGSTAWKRYVNAFRRKDNMVIKIKVAVIADGDVPVEEYLLDYPPDVYEWKDNNEKWFVSTSMDEINKIIQDHDGQIMYTKKDKHKLSSDRINEYLYQVLGQPPKSVKKSESEFHSYNDWTLEFNIAKSCLREMYLRALGEAKILTLKNVKIPKDISNPYKLVKPVLNGLSKAVTAQFLAEYINEKGSTLKSQIIADDSLRYIVDAIKFACGEPVEV